MAIFNVVMVKDPMMAPVLVEQHKVESLKEARKILSQWAEDGDKIVALKKAPLPSGRHVTPLVIQTMEEDSDIFGQYID